MYQMAREHRVQRVKQYQAQPQVQYVDRCIFRKVAYKDELPVQYYAVQNSDQSLKLICSFYGQFHDGVLVELKS